jgi:hypothetical protein
MTPSADCGLSLRVQRDRQIFIKAAVFQIECGNLNAAARVASQVYRIGRMILL